MELMPIEETMKTVDDFIAEKRASCSPSLRMIAAARHVLAEDIEAIVERAGRQWDFLHA